MAVKRFYFFGSYSSVKKPFIIQINSGADSSFTIPTTGGDYNYDVSTSDGQNFTGVSGNLTITFPSANTLYDISISGDFPRIYFSNTGDKDKLIDIKQWGDIEWTSMQSAFFGCSNTTCTATDVPNISSVTNMNVMFYNCTSLTTLDVSNWNVSSVTSMALMFYNCSSLTTLVVSNWDVSSVTSMDRMFYNCTSLTTLNVSNWNVSSVINMGNMFQYCSNFVSDINFSDPIKGSISLTDIRGMMAGTKSEKLLLQAGNLLSPANPGGNPSNWIASPNMKEVKLIGMKNNVDTTIGLGSAGAMTGKAWTDLLESFDISQSKTYKLSPTAYSDMETYVQGLGYTDIPDYLVNTSNNWTVIS